LLIPSQLIAEIVERTIGADCAPANSKTSYNFNNLKIIEGM
jgi:hypothetical protein